MMKNVLFGLLVVFGCNSLIAQGLPTNPQPGKCYVKCITKNEFREVEETIESYPAYTVIDVTPAVYKTVEEKVLIKEASKKFVYVPAVYETVERPYIKSELDGGLEVVPASFNKESRTIEVYPKTSGWEYKTLDDCVSANKEDCVSACYVEYPAQFKDYSYTTLASDATVRSKAGSKSDATYKVRVIKTPARVEEVEIPAQYSVIKKRVVEVPATSKSRTIPARTQTVKRTVLEKAGGITTWEEVDCSLLNPTLLPVFYQLGSARLTPKSKQVIDDLLLPQLAGNNVSVEIMSHTDSRGNDSYNMDLSQRRAESVVEYLVGKGISRSRLKAKGYGESRLVNRCSNGVSCSEADHKKNRRTEFRVLDGK